MGVSADEFKQGMKNWASGVAVVTTCNEDNAPQGMTATSFCSISVDPPQLLVCINQSIGTADSIRASGFFGVNILTREQEEISNRFASPIPPEERFEKVTYSTSESGVPLFDDSLASFDCRVVEMIAAGTHWIVVGEVQRIICRSGEALCYFNAGYRGLNMGS